MAMTLNDMNATLLLSAVEEIEYHLQQLEVVKATRKGVKATVSGLRAAGPAGLDSALDALADGIALGADEDQLIHDLRRAAAAANHFMHQLDASKLDKSVQDRIVELWPGIEKAEKAIRDYDST